MQKGAKPRMVERLRAAFARHSGFLLLLSLFVAFRLMAVALIRLNDTDFGYYYAWGQLGAMGYTTFADLWATYPPLFPALMLPVYELASRIPPWTNPRFFFDLLFSLWLLVFETGNLLLIYRLGARLDRAAKREQAATAALTIPADPQSSIFNLQSSSSPGLTAALFYALLFTPAYTLLGWFEPMPLFFLLLGLDLLLVERTIGWTGSAVASALGTLVKLTPALLVPVAIRQLGAKLSWRAARDEWFNRQSPGNLLGPTLYVLIYFGVTVGLGLWLARGNAELAVSSLRVNAMRPPWQSVWALIDGYYGYGLVPVDMRNFAGLETRQWQGRVPWAWVTAAFLGLYLWLYTRRYDWERVRTPIAFTAVSVIWLFLFAKGWSPQFLVWILAFIVLLTPTFFGVAMAIALSLINVVESYIFMTMLPDEQWILVGTVMLRTLLLLLLAGEFLSQIWPAAAVAQRLDRLSRNLAWGLMLAGVVAAVVATPRAAQAYQDRRLAEHPCYAAIEFLQAEADNSATPSTILTEDLTLWQDLYPWLRHDYALRVIDTYSPVDAPPAAVLAATLDELLTAGAAVWWVEADAAPSLARASYFTQPDIHLFEEQQLGACRVAELVRVEEDNPLAIATVEGGPIRLLEASAQADAAGANVDAVLYWQAAEPVNSSYTVFTQLFDAAGNLIAQQDNLPVNGLAPTDTWTPGMIIRDPYRLVIEPTAASILDIDAANVDRADIDRTDTDRALETVQLRIGLYNEEGRQLLTLPDGTTADHVVIPVRAP